MSKTIRLALRFVGPAILGLLASGCASYRYALPYPADAKTARTDISEEHPSAGTQFPIGTFYDKDHRVVFSGHQKGEQVGMMFGLVGVLVAHQANKAAGADRFGGHVDDLDFDLTTIARTALAEELAHAPATRLRLVGDAAETHAILEIVPYALVEYAPGGGGKVYVSLRARLAQGGATQRWIGRYFAAADGTHLQSTWEQEGRLETALREATERAVRMLVRDVHGGYPGSRTVKISGRWAWTARLPQLTSRAIVLDETDEHLVLRFVAADALVFSGTHFVERKDVTLEDAVFKIPGR
ncbi:hypothetical protein ASA1KI_08310 [Opitutales bacterium ASA1]|uniref:hypothetical protein n=1 Tax=Congregicoccus parvus TaxID=3081749 RepID=UPI002B2F6507|nr:hypothetical protein ASA1KI_08310 [Opitutales bacterium ASA1]